MNALESSCLILGEIIDNPTRPSPVIQIYYFPGIYLKLFVIFSESGVNLILERMGTTSTHADGDMGYGGLEEMKR